MTGQRAVEIIKAKLTAMGGETSVPLQKEHKGRTDFSTKLLPDGVEVDNLDKQPFLPWSAFEETIELLREHDGKAAKGSAQGGKLGDKALSIDSVEGRVALKVYRQEIGASVFRRATPITNILVWAGVCRHGVGELQLIPEREDFVDD